MVALMSQGQRVRSPSLQSMLRMFTNVLCTNDAYFHVLIDDIGEGGDGDAQTTLVTLDSRRQSLD